MFLKIAKWKKMLKEAYKSSSGLLIYNDGSGYYFKGDTWGVYVEARRIPKKELAAVIEVVGTLPVCGDRITFKEDGASQTNIDVMYEEIVNKSYRRECMEDIMLQVFSKESWKRIFILNGRKYAIREEIVEAIDAKKLQATESNVTGPIKLPHMAAWESTDMIFATYLSELEPSAEEATNITLKDIKRETSYEKSSLD